MDVSGENQMKIWECEHCEYYEKDSMGRWCGQLDKRISEIEVCPETLVEEK